MIRADRIADLRDPADRWRSPRSWVAWGSGDDDVEIVRLAWLARAIGADADRLCDWLSRYAPEDGTAKVRGKLVRWATPEEVMLGQREWGQSASVGTKVLWRSPDGNERSLAPAAAAKLLVRNGQSVPTPALVECLLDGDLLVDGHLLRLITPQRRRRSPPPPKRPPGRPRKASPIEARASVANVIAMADHRPPAPPAPVDEEARVTTAPAEEQQQQTANAPEDDPQCLAGETLATPADDQGRGRWRSRKVRVLVDGQLHPSIATAAAAVGISPSHLGRTLRETPSALVDGRLVQAAGEDGTPVSTAPPVTITVRPKKRPVWLDGTPYPTIQAAARILGVNPDHLRHRLRNRDRVEVNGHVVELAPEEGCAGATLAATTDDQAPPPPPAAGPQTQPEAPATAAEPDPPPPAPTAGWHPSPALQARLEQAARDVGTSVEVLLWSGLPRSPALRDAIAMLSPDDLMQLQAIAQVGALPLPAVPGQQRSTRPWYAAPPR